MSGAVLAPEDARRLRECVAGGGLAVFPTDTVYGLACDPERPAAVERLYALKGRPPARPAAVMFFALIDAVRALPSLQAAESAAIAALLPGAVTLLLPNRDRRFPLACGPDPDTLGLRVPLLDCKLSILQGTGVPVLQTSANRSGQSEARRVADLPREMLAQADLVLDGGELAGTASTVLDLRRLEMTGEWSVVREGALELGAIKRALG